MNGGQVNHPDGEPPGGSRWEARVTQETGLLPGVIDQFRSCILATNHIHYEPLGRLVIPTSLTDTHATMVGTAEMRPIRFSSVREEGFLELWFEFMFTGSWRDRGIHTRWDNPDLELFDGRGPATYLLSLLFPKTSSPRAYDPTWRIKSAMMASLFATRFDALYLVQFADMLLHSLFDRDKLSLTPAMYQWAAGFDKSNTHLLECLHGIIFQHWRQVNGAVNTQDRAWCKFGNVVQFLAGKGINIAVDGEVNREGHGQVDGQVYGQVYGQVDGQIDGQANEQVNGQANRQVHGHANGMVNGLVNGVHGSGSNSESSRDASAHVNGQVNGV